MLLLMKNQAKMNSIFVVILRIQKKSINGLPSSVSKQKLSGIHAIRFQMENRWCACKFIFIVSQSSSPSELRHSCFLQFYRKHFVCHHAAFMKVDRSRNSYGPAVSKNASCKAKIIIKIKLTTKDTAKQDPLVKVK